MDNKTYLMNTIVFNKIYTKYLAGLVFYRLVGDNNTEFQMITPKHEKMLLKFFEDNKIVITIK